MRTANIMVEITTARRLGLSVKGRGVFAQLVSETSIKMIDVEDLD